MPVGENAREHTMQSGSVNARDDLGVRPAEVLIAGDDGETRRKHVPGCSKSP